MKSFKDFRDQNSCVANVSMVLQHLPLDTDSEREHILQECLELMRTLEFSSSYCNQSVSENEVLINDVFLSLGIQHRNLKQFYGKELYFQNNPLEYPSAAHPKQSYPTRKAAFPDLSLSSIMQFIREQCLFSQVIISLNSKNVLHYLRESQQLKQFKLQEYSSNQTLNDEFETFEKMASKKECNTNSESDSYISSSDNEAIELPSTQVHESVSSTDTIGQNNDLSGEDVSSKPEVIDNQDWHVPDSPSTCRLEHTTATAECAHQEMINRCGGQYSSDSFHLQCNKTPLPSSSTEREQEVQPSSCDTKVPYKSENDLSSSISETEDSSYYSSSENDSRSGLADVECGSTASKSQTRNARKRKRYTKHPVKKYCSSSSSSVCTSDFDTLTKSYQSEGCSSHSTPHRSNSQPHHVASDTQSQSSNNSLNTGCSDEIEASKKPNDYSHVADCDQVVQTCKEETQKIDMSTVSENKSLKENQSHKVSIEIQNPPRWPISDQFQFTHLLMKIDFSHDNSVNNCLHIAVENNHIWSLKFLLRKFELADLISRQNSQGFSPLCQAVSSENHEVAAVLLQELIRSQGIRSITQAFPPGWLNNVSLPRLLHIYFHKSPEKWLVLAFCNECEFCDSSSESRVQKVPNNNANRVFGKSLSTPPKSSSRNKSSKSTASATNFKEQTSKKTAPVSGASLRYTSAQTHPFVVEAVDNSHSVLHCGHVEKPLDMMKKAVQKSNGCCPKHKIFECFVLVRGTTTPLLRVLAEEHSDLVEPNTPSKSHDEDNNEERIVYPEPSQSPSNESTHSRQTEVRLIGSTRQPAAEQQKDCNSYHKTIKASSQLLHVPDYEQMYEVLAGGFQNYPSDLPPKLLIAFHFGCGLSQYKRGRLEEATTSFGNCESIALSASHPGDVALVNLYKGDIQFSQLSYLEAIASYTTAVENYSKFDAVANINSVAQEFRMVVPSLSMCNSKLGAAYRSASKPVDAIKCYVCAIESAGALLSNVSTISFIAAQKDKLAAHTSLGNLYQNMGENSKALEQYEVSIELAMQLQDHISLGWAHGNMGNALLGLHRKDEALFHLQKALDIAVEHEPTPQAIGRTYNNLGTAYQSMNDLTKAEEYYDLALSQAIYGNDTAGQARVYGNIGNVLMLRKEFEQAIPHYTEVLRLSKDSSTISTALHNRGCAYYEWAESLRDDTKKESQFYLYGKDFESCEPEHKPPYISSTVKSYYREGSKDLMKALQYHEENLESIKGSQKGLSLSVSLFESNSRTFHRLQDCFVGLVEWQRALSIAEQCRARTLGELMLKNRENERLITPLSLQSIIDIVKETNSIIVYWSYTGARILAWVFVPGTENSSMAMIEVPVHDEQFDGKSFDYYLKSTLSEELVEHTFDMYSPANYASKHNDPVKKLYNLLGKPVTKVINQLLEKDSRSTVKKVVVIPDSYTSLLPMSCLLNSETNTFLGDNFRFEIMPSLLTVALVDQLPPAVVEIPADSQTMCVAGNPMIPQFEYNGEVWNLGPIPYAEKEANWVSYKLNTSPIIRENATKNTIKMRIMNAKVIHIATHGSASSGFLAFAGMMSSRRSEQTASKDVLLYPEEVEKLTIRAALVVLSSCDSGRGTVKADGIQGMARAFILAGAQAVLTTLWRVPDESASIFMQLFYQYLLDGYQTSEALHKAILSLRCFSKYSDYIHWSGYQLTGRDTKIVLNKTPMSQLLDQRLGRAGNFTRLEEVKKLESAFIKDPRLPTDVQILRGPPGLRHLETVKDFVHTYHKRFIGGIFVINCRHPDIIDASIRYIEEIIGTDIDQLSISEHQQALFVFDAITELPRSEKLLKVMKNTNVHIVFTSKSYESPDMLIKEVDRKLIRGCAVHHIEPLSMIESTQRIVHSVMKDHHLAPNNEDQKVFEKLAEFTSGSPVLVELASKSLLTYFRKNKEDAHKVLNQFAEAISLQFDRKSRQKTPRFPRKTRSISKHVQEEISAISAIFSTSEDQLDVWDTNSQYDSWDSIEELINSCQLSPEERLLLNTLCMFSCSPMPYSLVVEVSSLISMATQQPHKAGTVSSKLLEMSLMKKYPSPVVLHPSLTTEEHETEPEFMYIPQYISRSIWKNLEECDRVMALSTMFQALLVLHEIAKPLEACFLSGLCGLLLEMHEFEWQLMGEECYESVWSLNEKYKERIVEIAALHSVSYKSYIREHNDAQIFPKPKLNLDPGSTEMTVISTLPISRPIADLYLMKSKEHGVAVIISNKTFEKHPERPGTDHNENNFAETFRFLGYRVEVRRQCTKAELEELFDNIDSLIKDTDDSFVCCLLSHGGENFIYGSDNKKVSLRLQKDSLEAKLTKCKKVDQKPKMFFAPFSRQPRKLRCQPDGDEDVAFYYSPLAEDDSTRHHDTGALYVDTLCRVLCQTAPSKTLSDIHEIVTKEVKGWTDSLPASSKSEKQMTKEVFFFDDL